MGGIMKDEWPEEHTVMLIAFKKRGYSASEIAEMIERETKVKYTRNAICGKLYKLRRKGFV